MKVQSYSDGKRVNNFIGVVTCKVIHLILLLCNTSFGKMAILSTNFHLLKNNFLHREFVANFQKSGG
jgi:hypothetical protein